MEGLEGFRDRDGAFDDELLRQRLPEAHVHGALDLAFHECRVDRPADVVGGDHLRQPALVVDDRDLRRPGVREVCHRLVDLRPELRRPVDDELSPVLLPGELCDLPVAESSLQLLRGIDHGPAAEHGRARGGRLARLEVAVRIHGDAHALGWEAELLAGDLLQDRVHALPHLRPGVVERHRAVGLGSQHGAAVLDHAVADAGVLDAAGDPGEASFAVGVAYGQQRLLEAHAGAELLPGPEPVADLERVAPADLPAVDPDLLGEHVEHAFDREVGLVDAESAHRAARRVVRVDRRALDVHVRNLVGAARVSYGPLEHLVADAGVRARVAHDPGPDGNEAAVDVAPDRVLEPHRMALRVEAQALLARERDQHRPARASLRAGRRGTGH